MSVLKVNFESIYSVLEANQDKKVKDIMNLLIPLMVSKQRDSNSRTNDDGELEIFCYYHKEWELTTQVEYGAKSGSKTGLNSMCKVGVNAWTKQQRDFKTNKAELLQKVIDEDLSVEDLKDEILKLEDIKDSVIPLIDYHHDLALVENV